MGIQIATFETLPVDVNVIQERVPEIPSGVLLTAAYESGSLMEVIVSWNKQVSFSRYSFLE